MFFEKKIFFEKNHEIKKKSKIGVTSYKTNSTKNRTATNGMAPTFFRSSDITLQHEKSFGSDKSRHSLKKTPFFVQCCIEINGEKADFYHFHRSNDYSNKIFNVCTIFC